MSEEPIGVVTNFFSKPMVAAIQLTASLKVGDHIHIKGQTTDLTMEVKSMQIDHNPTDSAEGGAEVGLKLPDRARAGDKVFKVTD